jgi:imidazolonepropionase-like amidohydrolase
MRTVIRNGQVFDTASLDFAGERTVVIEDGRIVDMDGGQVRGDLEIDAGGAYVMPGFIDSHVHFRLMTLNFRRLASCTEVEFGIVMAQLSRRMLERGFTSVRDTGGDLRGLLRAVSYSWSKAPRVVKSGLMISQTGGHGDIDGSERAVPECGCEMLHSAFSIIADGPDAVRKAARHLLRDGSDFLKIHVSGGVASPRDPMDCMQYTPAEIEAAVVEARNRRTYVTAHAYYPDAIRMAVENGVACIEHGNLIDAPTARLMAEKGAVLVPTLVTYSAMGEMGERLGLPKANLDKNKVVLASGLESLQIAKAAGVEMAFGTDLIGETQTWQNREFAIRAEVLSAREILHSMYVTGPRLLRKEGEVGVLAHGALGDVVVTGINPLDDIAALANPDRVLSHVLKGGEVVWQSEG